MTGARRLMLLPVVLLVPLAGWAQPAFPFQDPSRSVEERAQNIVSLLTLPEKVSQMMNDAPAVERLGIPAYNWWNECLHGVARTDYPVTSFPQAIGMAATWDTEALFRMADYAAEEGRAIYNDASAKGNRSIYHGLTYWSPNVNIFRDPRWGRGQETYGEDPYLTSRLGLAFVRGLQGGDPKYLKASACAKHYSVHSGPEWNRSSFNAVATQQDLWDTYLPAFEALVTEGAVSGVMCAYNALDGQPSCGNDFLTEVLRIRWGFKGYVTSDCGAVNNFVTAHKTHPNKAFAAADAVRHDTDCECSGNGAYKELAEALAEDFVTESDIDESLARLFAVRIRLGLFDPPGMVPYSGIGTEVLGSPAHRAHAAKMARESLVLLRNEDEVLPLSRSGTIALVGPNAREEQALLGNYSGTPDHVVSIYEGLVRRLGEERVLYRHGCGYVALEEGDPEPSETARSVADADVIIFVGGISPFLEGESMKVNAEGFRGGDRLTISLPRIQRELLTELLACGKPVVLVLLSGSAIGLEWESQHVPAILQAWYPGQEGGSAIADVLLGDYNPSGRLPVTFYRSEEDLPPFEDYGMEGRTYRYFRGPVCYPFGHGLSYTSFRYSRIRVERDGKGLIVRAVVRNSGIREGDEVVQLYVTPGRMPFRTPIRSLKGFMRVSLRPGESRTVEFRLSAHDLEAVGEDGVTVPLEGRVDISVGGGQPLPGVSFVHRSIFWKSRNNPLFLAQ